MPAEGLSSAQAALATILEGQSATAGLAWFREQGGHVANQVWYGLRSTLEASISEREGIYAEPQHLRPTAQQITQMQTRDAKGYMQQVEVLVRQKGSTDIISVPYTSIGRQLRSRQAIVREALDIYSGDNAEKYGQVVLGAVYTGTYEAVPAE